MNELERVEAGGAMCAARVGYTPARPWRKLVRGEEHGASYRNIVRAEFREAYLRPNRRRPD